MRRALASFSAAWLFGAGAGEAADSLVLDRAEIAKGQVEIAGRAPPGRTVSVRELAGVQVVTGTDGRFLLRTTQRTADCVVTLSTSGSQPLRRTALLAGCAPVLVSRGRWSAAARYAAGDLVEHDGGSWQAITGNRGQRPGTKAGEASWRLFAARGPTGATGPQGKGGKTGPQGPQGAAGTTGPQGAAGTTGPQGGPGKAGPQGGAGEAGPQGATGATGAQGPQGAPGIAGLPGPEGPAGASGPPGEPGGQGPQGPQGSGGPAGTAGPQGPQGPAGETGASWGGGPIDALVPLPAMTWTRLPIGSLSSLDLPAGGILQIQASIVLSKSRPNDQSGGCGLVARILLDGQRIGGLTPTALEASGVSVIDLVRIATVARAGSHALAIDLFPTCWGTTWPLLSTYQGEIQGEPLRSHVFYAVLGP